MLELTSDDDIHLFFEGMKDRDSYILRDIVEPTISTRLLRSQTDFQFPLSFFYSTYGKNFRLCHTLDTSDHLRTHANFLGIFSQIFCLTWMFTLK